MNEFTQIDRNHIAEEAYSGEELRTVKITWSVQG